MHWFESLLARCQHEMWIGDAAAIAPQEGRKQKHDRPSAALILKLMLENRFPRIWVPTVAERDPILLWHQTRGQKAPSN